MVRLRFASIILVVVGLCVSGAFLNAQTPIISAGLRLPQPETHRLVSKYAGETFDIRVVLPPTIPGERVRFPVVYMTDATGESLVSDTMLRVMMLSDAPRFIAVQIGYAGTRGYLDTMLLRQRDLTPVSDAGERSSWMFAGAPVPAIKSGRAEQFLSFIREELMPFINARYSSDPADRIYAGHSLGGLFGCFTLFTRPDTFTRYVIGSPSLYWGNDHLFTLAEQYTKGHRDLSAKLFLGAGGLEDNASNPTVKNVRRLEALLVAQKYPGLTMTTRVFPDESHLSVWTMNLIHGLIEVMGRPAPENTVGAIYQKSLSATQRQP